ncbi:MAG TPA: EF-hand domain-containing protein [Kofleriaceae bacterium]|jgi:hypothetical protein|nr:EF-hand domain-containing protein [Kofleriaceae bacterium]
MSITKKKIGFAALIVALATAGSIATAQPSGDDNDGNADRQAMREQWKAKREAKKQEMLAKYDTNKDGKLDQNERLVMRDDLMTARFAKLDTDGNGQISLAEFKAGAKLMKGHGHHHRFGRHGFGRSRGQGGGGTR